MNSPDSATTAVILDIGASCDYLGGLGRTALYDLIKARSITPVKIGRRTFIARAELDRFVADLGQPGSSVPS